MSTQVLAPPRRQAGKRTGFFKFTRISKAAAKQVAKFDHAKRALILRSFEGQRWEGSTPVYGRGWSNVWHYRIDASVRVTFAQKAGEITVWHVGEHEDFDHFADHGDRFRTTQFYPMQEYLMKAEQSLQQSVVTEVAVEATTAAAAQLSPEHLLGQALLQAVAPVFESPVAALRNQLGHLESDVVSTYDDLGQRLIEQSAAAKAACVGLAEQLASLQAAVDEQIAAATNRHQADCESLQLGLAALTGSVAAQQTKLQAAEATAAMRVEELGALQRACEARLEAQAGAVVEIAEQLTKQQTELQRLAALNQEHFARERQLGERIVQLEAQTFGAFVNRVWSVVRDTGRRMVVGVTATLARARRKEVL